MGVLLIGLAAGTGWGLLQQQISSSVPRQLRCKLNEALPDGWTAQLRRATFTDGVGFEINDLDIKSDQSRQPIIRIGTALLDAPVSAIDLCQSCDVKPRSMTVHRAKVHIVRDDQGRWNLGELANAFKNQQNACNEWIPIHLQDSQIVIVDQTVHPKRQIQIDQVSAIVEPIEFNGKTLLSIQGSLIGIASAKVDFHIHLDPKQQIWRTQLAANRAVLGMDLISILPQSMQEKLVGLQSLSGLASIAGMIEGDFQSVARFELNGHLAQLSASHRDFPAPLLNASTQFEVNNEQIKLTDAKGLVGDGRFHLRQCGKYLDDSNRWYAFGEVNQFLFNSRLEKWLPQSCINFMYDFNPDGIGDAKFEVVQEGKKTVHRRLHANLTDMSFMYIKVPYQLNRCVGKVDWIDNVLTFNVQANERDQKIICSGTVNNPGRRATYKVDIDVPGSLPIDEKLRQAIACYPTLSAAVDNLRINGRVRGKAQVTKPRPERQHVDKKMLAELVQCNVRHRFFDYPIANVNGHVKYEAGDVRFQKLTGNTGSARIECNGQWSENAGLRLKFLCNDVPLDHQLKMAVNETIRDIWNGFRPRGSVGLLTVDLLKPNDGPLDLTVFADLGSTNNRGIATSNIQIHPEWFPYEINQVTGQVRVGQGRVQLRNIKGRHARTWMVCQGEGQYNDAVWSVTLQDLLAGSLRIDNDFLNALPLELADSIRQLQFDGLMTVKGDITLSGNQQYSEPPKRNDQMIAQASYLAPAGQNSSTSLAWNLRLDMDQASLFVGTPVSNVFGHVNILGQHDGDYSENIGSIAINSLTAFGTQITNLKGPFLINKNGISVGSYANPASSTIQPEPIVGNAFGGVLRLDGQKATTKFGEFFLQMSLAGAQLDQILREWAPLADRATGRTFTTIRLQGNESGTRSFRGSGTFQLRNAEIYELPIVVALLKILNIKQLNRTAFDSSNVDFTIENEAFQLNRVELIGDAISLKGNGRIGFDQSLGLNFYTVWGRGRFYIPLVSELYREGSKRILWIKVDGTVGNPQSHREFLPRLNDTIRQLFEPPPAENEVVPELTIDDAEFN